jgi:hypothetical protein
VKRTLFIATLSAIFHPFSATKLISSGLNLIWESMPPPEYRAIDLTYQWIRGNAGRPFKFWDVTFCTQDRYQVFLFQFFHLHHELNDLVVMHRSWACVGLHILQSNTAIQIHFALPLIAGYR